MDATLHVWNLTDGSLHHTLRGHTNFAPLFAPSFSPDGRLLASPGGDATFEFGPDSRSVWIHPHDQTELTVWRALTSPAPTPLR